MVANSRMTGDASQNSSPVRLPEKLPADVREWLSRTSVALIQSFADNLRSLILFGSAAEGRMRPSSDVNLLVVLDRLDVASCEPVDEKRLARIAELASRIELALARAALARGRERQALSRSAAA